MADPDIFAKTFNFSTQKVAFAAAKTIQEIYTKPHDADSTDYKALGRLIDKAAVDAMQEVFETQSRFYIEIKGSEGRKDTRRDGVESPDLYGSYGPSKGERVEIVNDAVEGTSSASRNLPGATSVLAACLNQTNGFLPTGNFDYMSKLFGPPALKGKISLELSPSENYKIALNELKITDPRELCVVILDRPRNKFEIESAQNMGLNTILIPGGDLMPGILATADPSILTKVNSRVDKNTKGIILIGSGGWEEGIIAAAAAKITGGHAQGKIYSEDKETVEQAGIMEVDQLIPANSDSILISATPITNDLWFGVSGISKSLGPKTISISKTGFKILSQITV